MKWNRLNDVTQVTDAGDFRATLVSDADDGFHVWWIRLGDHLLWWIRLGDHLLTSGDIHDASMAEAMKEVGQELRDMVDSIAEACRVRGHWQ